MSAGFDASGALEGLFLATSRSKNLETEYSHGLHDSSHCFQQETVYSVRNRFMIRRETRGLELFFFVPIFSLCSTSYRVSFWTVPFL